MICSYIAFACLIIEDLKQSSLLNFRNNFSFVEVWLSLALRIRLQRLVFEGRRRQYKRPLIVYKWHHRNMSVYWDTTSHDCHILYLFEMLQIRSSGSRTTNRRITDWVTKTCFCLVHKSSTIQRASASTFLRRSCWWWKRTFPDRISDDGHPTPDSAIWQRWKC